MKNKEIQKHPKKWLTKENAKYGGIGICAGLLNGFFGSGGGSLLVPMLQKFCKMEDKKSHATAVAVIMPLSIVSSFFYISKGFFDWNILLFLCIGGAAGGVLGGFALKKIKKSWLSKLFGALLCAAGLGLILR